MNRTKFKFQSFTHLLRMNSIANRIQWAYSVILGLVIFGMIMQGLDLSGLEWQMETSIATAEIVDSIRDLRRFEKNWFLYSNPNDLHSLKETLGQVYILLESDGQRYAEISSVRLLENLRIELDQYKSLIDGLQWPDQRLPPHSQEEIRVSGHRLIQWARTFQTVEQKNITRRIQEMNRNTLIAGGLVLVIIFYLRKKLLQSILRPLQEMVTYTEEISLERYEQGWKDSNIKEIRSLTGSLNRMVKKIKERERQLLQKSKMATLGTLIAGVAHELNNPLSNISTSSEILHETVHERYPEEHRLLLLTERITGQSDRAKRIVRSLLEFSREREVVRAPVRLGDLLPGVAEMVKGKIGPGIDFRVHVEKDGVFSIDRHRIEQVLINLIINATQSMTDEGTIELVGFMEPDHSATISVSDSGSGIPDQILGQIFDPFFTTKDVGEGLGLGLAVSREIIEKHGGKIHVETEVGKGTRFTLELPEGELTNGQNTAN